MSTASRTKQVPNSSIPFCRYYCVLLLFVALFSPSISQNKTSYGLKGGIGIWKLASLQKSPNLGGPIHYSYPIGYSLGFYINNRLSAHFALVNELVYQNRIARVRIYTGNEGIVNQKIITTSLNIPFHVKYQIPLPVDVYLFAGPSLEYLIKANYEYDDEIYIDDRGTIEITKDLPVISTTLEFGLGKDLQISRADLNLELRAQWGLLNYHARNIGKWNTAGLLFLIGYQL